MDPILYKAAVEGNIDVVVQNKDQLDVEVTPNNNTVLHVVAQFHNNATCVKEILALQSSLLRWVNVKREIPLHIAAREGHYDVIQALIECAKALGEELESGVGLAKEMLRMTTEDGDTALHEAVRNNHLDVVKFLTLEDPEFSQATNNAQESPLYLAVERGHCDIASEILRTCTSPTYNGPYGRTALHAAAIWDCQGCTKILFDRKPSLIKEADKNGWTPLHYAAKLGYKLRVSQLLDLDKSVACLIAEEDEGMTALHIAASEGHVDVMKELLSRCPDCWEMTNSTGKNILHTAVESEKKDAIEFILENYWHKSLINQKDVDGNTPLHLFAMSKNKSLSNLVKHPKVDKKAFNKNNLTPLDILEPLDIVRKRNIAKELRSAGAVLGLRNVFKAYNDAVTARNKAREDEEGVIPREPREVANTHLIVAALIATVTFTAGFTVPGGYEDNEGPNQGMAILTRKAAFQAFVIWNTIAMIFSTCAVYLHFITSTYVDEDKVSNRLASAMILVILAMVAMVIAFVTGSYAVLAHPSGLGIAVCVIGCFSFPVYYLLIKSRWKDDDL